jgi:hypothetical protein
MLVKMRNVDTGNLADVHPDEVANWRPYGWEIVADKSPSAKSVETSADEAEAPSGERRVAKGPRGMWFVYHGEKRVSSGFDTMAEAEAEMNG